MPITEAQVWTWLCNNWPIAVATISLAVTLAGAYILAYLRVSAVLQQIEKQGQAIQLLTNTLVHQRKVLRALVVKHCAQHESDLAELITKLEEQNEGKLQ